MTYAYVNHSCLHRGRRCSPLEPTHGRAHARRRSHECIWLLLSTNSSQKSTDRIQRRLRLFNPIRKLPRIVGAKLDIK